MVGLGRRACLHPTGESPMTTASRSLATALSKARFASGLLRLSYASHGDTTGCGRLRQRETRTKQSSTYGCDKCQYCLVHLPHFWEEIRIAS
jgi:hypothetical protein